ncbi:MAG TPA: DUF4293 domain-containing protein [Bacteroidales bacterium]|nr:DUF4293 domain-containing protein [Bacteroidales bacterium]
MIQRVQSVYLLLVTVLMSLMLVRPYAQLNLADSQRIVFTTLAVKQVTDTETVDKLRGTIPLLALVLITGAVSFFNIFLFNRRVVQIRVCIVNTFLLFLTVGLMCYYYYTVWNAVEHTGHFFRMSAIAPVLGIILTFLAYRSIHRDELLVNSYNRIR